MLLEPLTFHINVLVLGSENTWQEVSFVTLCFAMHRQCTDTLFLRDAALQSTQPIRWHTDLTVSDKRCEGSRCAIEANRREVPSDCGRLK